MSKIDEKIKLLFTKVEEKKKEVERIQTPNYKTNMIFSYHEDLNNSSNLNVVGTERELVDILAFLNSKRDYYSEAATYLGSNAEFTWQGFRYNEWVHDIQARHAKVTVMKKKNELKILEERLNKVVSPEVRRELEVDALSELLED